VKEAQINGLNLRDWLRREWERTGLPLSLANEACGVKNAATRKYLTKDHLWYFPPPDVFGKLVEYANRHGEPAGAPYFSADGQKPLTPDEWSRMRSKFYCKPGITNVWHEPPLNGHERIKAGSASVHLNQKPLSLLQMIIEASSDEGDVVWEPFGGLCSVAVAAYPRGSPYHPSGRISVCGTEYKTSFKKSRNPSRAPSPCQAYAQQKSTPSAKCLD
jgi:site-specific DNA-methyltransferase (adenine-specific)